MGTLVYQIQRVSDTSKNATARVAGVEPVSMPDNETTFEELQARIQKTIDALKAMPADSLDGKEEKEIVVKTRSGEYTASAKDYLLTFALPNFYFHVTTAYDILRHNGVPVGKSDYLGLGAMKQRSSESSV